MAGISTNDEMSGLRGTEMHRQRHALGLREALMPRPVSDDGRLQDFIPHVQTSSMSTVEWLRAGRLAREASTSR